MIVYRSGCSQTILCIRQYQAELMPKLSEVREAYLAKRISGNGTTNMMQPSSDGHNSTQKKANNSKRGQRKRTLEQHYYRKANLWLFQAALHQKPNTDICKVKIEMLAVVFALDKFEQSAYGRPVTIKSDHKPLETIAKKPLRCAHRKRL